MSFRKLLVVVAGHEATRAIGFTSPRRREVGRGSGRVGPIGYDMSRNTGRSELPSPVLAARLSQRESVDIRDTPMPLLIESRRYLANR